MKRHIPLILLTLLTLLVSGCGVFPYVTEPTLEATEAAPAATATFTVEPTVPVPTATLIPSPTPTPTEDAETPVEPTPLDDPEYILQPGSPVALPNFNHPEAGCDWLGVAGQVFNAEGLEVTGLTVLIGDSQRPESQPFQAQTGQALAYGLGGYEIQIAEAVEESSGRFWIQVFNSEGAPLTARHAFDTYEDCSRNLILINFIPRSEPGLEKDAATPEPTTPAYP